MTAPVPERFLYPPSLTGTVRDLSPEAREEIASLNHPAPWRWLIQCAMLWGSIALFIAVAELADHWLVTALAVVLIGTRQLSLGLLMHEQAHHNAFRFRGGDVIANVLVAYPLLVLTTEKYAQVHLSHHQHYFTGRDPDFVRKNGPEWTYPKRRGELLRIFASDLFGLNLIKLIRGKTLGKVTLYQRLGTIPAWVRPAYYVGWAVALTALGWWPGFLLYWLLPLLTVMQVFLRLLAICEHQYGIESARVEDTTPLVILPWWQRLLLSDLNFGMHIYHHYLPGIPFCHLPRVHRIFDREGLVRHDRILHGYGSVVRAALAPSAPADEQLAKA